MNALKFPTYDYRRCCIQNQTLIWVHHFLIYLSYIAYTYSCIHKLWANLGRTDSLTSTIFYDSLYYHILVLFSVELNWLSNRVCFMLICFFISLVFLRQCVQICTTYIPVYGDRKYLKTNPPSAEVKKRTLTISWYVSFFHPYSPGTLLCMSVNIQMSLCSRVYILYSANILVNESKTIQE